MDFRHTGNFKIREKVFLARESLLTETMRNRDLKPIYHYVMFIAIVILINYVCYCFNEEERQVYNFFNFILK